MLFSWSNLLHEKEPLVKAERVTEWSLPSSLTNGLMIIWSSWNTIRDTRWYKKKWEETRNKDFEKLHQTKVWVWPKFCCFEIFLNIGKEIIWIQFIEVFCSNIVRLQSNQRLTILWLQVFFKVTGVVTFKYNVYSNSNRTALSSLWNTKYFL